MQPMTIVLPANLTMWFYLCLAHAVMGEGGEQEGAQHIALRRAGADGQCSTVSGNQFVR